MNSKHDLLFLACSLRNRLLQPAQFAEAFASWSAGGEGSIDDVLERKGWISPADRVVIEAELRALAPTAADETKDRPYSAPGEATAAWTGPSAKGHGSTRAAPDEPTKPRCDLDSTHCGTTADSDLTMRLSDAPAARARYRASQLHATGGIGEVWLARDEHIGRDVALKVLRSDKRVTDNHVTRFVREARVTGILEHPGIVPVYDLAESADGSQTFYTMRFIQGRTLAQAVDEFHGAKVKRSPGSREFVGLLNAFVSVCNALAFAHSRGVLHRDLKGQNVVLGNYGEVILLDWGLAKLRGVASEGESEVSSLADRDSPLDGTLGGEVLGTPAYMAPEQAEGRIDDIDERTDVYGLGAILYKILTSRAPFGGGATRAILKQVCETEPQRPRKIVPATPPELEAICLRAMAKKPADRYGSALELAADVQRFLADEPVSVYREPLSKRAGRWVKRHKTMTASAAALLVTATAALGISRYLLAAEQAQTESARQTAVAQLQVTRNTIDRMMVRMLDDRLPHIPQMEAMRADIADEALQSYNQISVDPRRDPAAARSYATALRQGANIYRLGGRLAKARESYQSALLQWDEADRADHTKGGDRGERARILGDDAGLLFLAGKFREADGVYREAIAFAEDPARRADSEADALARTVTYLQSDYGYMLIEMGRWDEALKAYLAAEAAILPLTKRNRAQPVDVVLLHNSLWGQARIARERKHYAESEALLTRALNSAHALATGLHDNSDAQGSLASMRFEQGELFAAQAQIEPARAAYTKAIALFEQLARDFPSTPSHRADLAQVLASRARLAAATPESQHVRIDLDRAIELGEALVADYPDQPGPLGDLGMALGDLGRFERARGRRDEARSALERAIAAERKAIAKNPDRVSVVDALAKDRAALEQASGRDAGAGAARSDPK